MCTIVLVKPHLRQSVLRFISLIAACLRRHNNCCNQFTFSNLDCFPLSWGKRIRMIQSEFDLIKLPSMYCFFAKCNEKIKSSSREWGEGEIIVKYVIYHSRRSCWGQDNYTICSRMAAKTSHFSLLKVLFNPLRIDVSPSSSSFDWQCFQAVSDWWKCSAIWAAQCLVVRNWSLWQWTVVLLGTTKAGGERYWYRRRHTALFIKEY